MVLLQYAGLWCEVIEGNWGLLLLFVFGCLHHVVFTVSMMQTKHISHQDIEVLSLPRCAMNACELKAVDITVQSLTLYMNFPQSLAPA